MNDHVRSGARLWAMVLVASFFVVSCEGGGMVEQMNSSSSRLVRGCSSSVWGRLGSDWQRFGVTAGPLTFYNGARTSFPSGPTTRKLLILIEGKHEVTVSVPESLVGSVALFYDPAVALAQEMTLEQGEEEVTFIGCGPGESPHGKDGPTQFAGSVLVPTLKCISLRVESEGDAWIVSLPEKGCA